MIMNGLRKDRAGLTNQSKCDIIFNGSQKHTGGGVVAITQREAREIYKLVMEVFDGWISGSDYRNRGGAGINEAALPRIKQEVIHKLQNYFTARDPEVGP